ncbi:MAG: hypothetical protein ACJAY8_001199 [Sphingobacteriales bacterium]|jgi:uncharacterized protein (DUF1697 family)
MSQANTFVALLRGINVGENHKVPMADLQHLMEGNDYQDVTTILNTGNVVFKKNETDIKKLEQDLQTILEDRFQFPIPVILRSKEHVQGLIQETCFGDLEDGKKIKLYVSSAKEDLDDTISLPITSSGDSFSIIKVTKSEIFSILDLSNGKSVKAMGMLEKYFGKNITTRNLNTLKKIADLL